MDAQYNMYIIVSMKLTTLPVYNILILKVLKDSLSLSRPLPLSRLRIIGLTRGFIVNSLSLGTTA